MSFSTARETAPLSLGRLVPWAVGVLWLIVFTWGWHVRDERLVNAEFGLGYGLGIVGLGCMSAMLLYSVRKRARSMRALGPIRRWLSIHMFLGLAGPLCILFHANFSLGSLNSTVSLACVVLVASSGVFGRFLYPRIHNGLTGQRATLKQLGTSIEAKRLTLSTSVATDAALETGIRELETLALSKAGLFPLLARTAVLRKRSRALLRRTLTPAAARALRSYTDGVSGILRFRVYERLFGLWHAFHLPLSFVLFGAAAVHVLAVHIY